MIALQRNDKDFHIPVVNYFREKQAALLKKYIIAARKQESVVFENKIKTIQFATVKMEDNKLLNELVENKLGVENSKALIYISEENKFAL